MDKTSLLHRLKKETNRALEEAAKNKELFDRDAINWKHLRCADTQWVESLQNRKPFFRVIVEEAGDAPKLVAFVRKWLSEYTYFHDVVVETEW